MDTRTNLITNPSFETALTGWTPTEATNGGSLTATQSTTFSQFGTGAAKAVETLASEDDYLLMTISGIAASTAYTISAYVYLDVFTAQATSSQIILAVPRPSATGLGQALLTATATGVWVRYSATCTTGASDTSIDIRLYTPQGTTYFDGILLERSGSLGTYFDGSTITAGITHAWTGLANGSTSTESDQHVKFNNSGLRPHPFSPGLAR